MSKDTIVHLVDKTQRRLATSTSSAAKAISIVMARDKAPPEPSIDRVPAFSDDWLALAFTKRHGADLRYCALWGKWLCWDGARWKIDETKRIFDFVRKIIREVAVECNEPNVSKQMASSRTVAAVKVMAESDLQHATHSDQWDAAAPLIFGQEKGESTRPMTTSLALQLSGRVVNVQTGTRFLSA